MWKAAKWNRDLLRNRPLWLAAVATLLLTSAGAWWGVRSYQRSQVRELLNQFAPFRNPALEVQFPASVAASGAHRALLEQGQRAGFWIVRETNNGQSLETRITREGQRYFSTVGQRIVAGFSAGRRTVTEIDSLDGEFPSRRVRFRYVWTELHPALVILGGAAPETGKEYAGEALLFYENDDWKFLHWMAPEFEAAQNRFNALDSAIR